MNLKRPTKPFDLIKLCLFYGNIFIFYDLSSFTMSIVNLKVSISCNDIINSYNNKKFLYSEFIRIYHQRTTFVMRTILIIHPYNYVPNLICS
jgi:hypothetical protein